MDFLTVHSVEDARQKLLSHAKDWMASGENVPLQKALGRILSADIRAPLDIPPFRRSTVDGYAVFAADTAAAGESIPVPLTLRGRVDIGKPASVAIGRGECAEVPTGGMLPDGADAVVMVEYAESFHEDGIAVYSGVAIGENVVQIGEDTTAGTLLLRRGRRVLPQDVGALAAAGITAVPVYIPPRMTILSTGDELVSPETEPDPGQVRDVNTFALSALAVKTGYTIAGVGVLPDDETALENAVRSAQANGLYAAGLIRSPIRGGEGNIEYLLHLTKRPAETALDCAAVARQESKEG